MVPDIDLQLQIVLKSLSDIVAPAVDPADKVASEQLQLVIATLKMVRDRVPLERRMARRLLEDEIGLADRIAAAGVDDRGLLDAVAAAKDVLADPECDTLDFDNARSVLTTRTVSVIAAAGSAGVESLALAVIGGTRVPLERLRAWCLPSGFEPDPGQVAALPAVL